MIRQLTESDDLNKVAELIYKTDDLLFPYLFGKQSKGIPKIIGLIKLDNNSFSYKNIICCVDDGVEGILIGYDPSDIDKHLESEDYRKVFKSFDLIRLGLKMLPVKSIMDKKDIAGLYIQNICVDKCHRGKGIGSSLIDYYLEAAKRKNYQSVYLDVAFNNEKAKSLYERKGFTTVNKNKISFLKDGFYRMKYFTASNHI